MCLCLLSFCITVGMDLFMVSVIISQELNVLSLSYINPGKRDMNSQRNVEKKHRYLRKRSDAKMYYIRLYIEHCEITNCHIFRCTVGLL